ncbi:MAG TPA: tyrosine-type recombinase/integrase [Hyphomicrobium sp.]|nr:tyrosine-type recombinase/integrase [Hyphomicrobium sp.]
MVPLNPTLVHAMQRLITADGETNPGATVFGYAGRWSVNQAIKRVCANADPALKYYSSHKLGRHAFATRLLDSGKSLQHVKDAGGWASIQIVSDAYGHLEVNETHAAILDRGSVVARELSGERLTITHNGQHRKGKTNPKKKPNKNKSLTRGGH